MITKSRLQVIRSFGTGGTGAEIGVFKGDFSEEILKGAEPAKLYLIDPWENQEDPGLKKAWYSAGSDNDMGSIFDEVQKRFADQIASGQVEMVREFSGPAMAKFDDASLDFVYIDGDHRYEGVAADLASAYAKVKKGGIIAADDYSIGGWWKDGVVRAMNEFIGQHAGEVEIHFANHRQVVLRKLA